MMFFTPVTRHGRVYPQLRQGTPSWDRLFSESLFSPAPQSCVFKQDDKAYTITIDVPGLAKEQLNIGIEANVVRIESQAGAPRQIQAAYELPQDIDVAASSAKLENGVLALTLAKQAPVSRVTQLAIH